MGRASRAKKERDDAQKAAFADFLADQAARPRRVRVRASKQMTSAGHPDMVLLAELHDAAQRLDALQLEIRGLAIRAEHSGISWGLVGNALGISRQAARQRFAEGK